MNIKSLLILVVLFAALPVIASDKQIVYEMGTFVGAQQVNDGLYTAQSGGYGEAHNFGHNMHVVVAPEGTYFIESPKNVGLSIFANVMTEGHAPTAHKAWFMDDLHNGDKVLFNAECNKHGHCTIRLPNPEDPNKHIQTEGTFKPNVAKTNTNNLLCGTGKLTADAEAQLCGK